MNTFMYNFLFGTVIINVAVAALIWHFSYVIGSILSFKGIVVTIATVFGLVKLRKYLNGKRFEEIVDVTGKNFIVTGANAGIGKEIAKGLAMRGAKVYMVCRSLSRAQKARSHLMQQGCPPSNLGIMLADMANFQSVVDFCKKFKEDVGELDGLICNAGIMTFRSPLQLTVDGNELTFQSNYLGHYLMALHLMPLLESSKGRIVNVSSCTHNWSTFSTVNKVSGEFDLSDQNELTGFTAYARSKLAQVMMSFHLGDQMTSSGSRVRVVSCHPGNTATSILDSDFLSCLYWSILRYLVAYLLRSSEAGAQTPLFCALSEKIVQGAYHAECAPNFEGTNSTVFNANARTSLENFTNTRLRKWLP